MTETELHFKYMRFECVRYFRTGQPCANWMNKFKGMIRTCELKDMLAYKVSRCEMTFHLVSAN